jgi:hypothetical protein
MSSSDSDHHNDSCNKHEDDDYHYEVSKCIDVDDYDSDSDKKPQTNKQKYAPVILKKHVQFAPIIVPIVARNIKPEDDKYKFCTMDYILNTDTSHCSKCGFALHSWYD